MSEKFSAGKSYKVIALCLARYTGYDQQNMIRGLCRHCADYNVKVMVFATISAFFDGGKNDVGEGQIFSLFEPEKFDAVVIMSETFFKSQSLYTLVNRVKKANVPIISIDRNIEGCININFDYDAAFEKIVRHIVEEHKLTKVNFIAGYKGNAFSEVRLNIYKKVLEENHIPIEEERIGYGDFWAKPTREVVQRFLESDLEFPEAIICANDIMAIECMRSLKQKGFRIPEDVIVTGFDGVDMEKYYSPRLTTAEFDEERLCQAIMETVNSSSEDLKAMTQRTLIVPYRFRLGASCGCVMLQSGDVEEKLYEWKFIIDEREVFQADMFNMVTELGNFPDLHKVFPEIPAYYERTKLIECWMCFNENFMNQRGDVAWNFSRDDGRGMEYTDRIRVGLHAVSKRTLDTESFAREDLLPNIDKVLHRTDYLMFIPLHLQGYTIGYMANTFLLDNFEGIYYTSFIQSFKHILDLYASRAMLERLYVCDVLTSVYNRRGFYRNIANPFAQSKIQGSPFTLISIDMDGLKKINDTYGHSEGDYAIHAIGEAMLFVTEEDEVCARFGGDEFLIAFLDEEGSGRAEKIVEQIRDYLDGVNAISGKAYKVEASFGIFSQTVTERTTLDDFIKNADALMYEDKKSRKAERKE